MTAGTESLRASLLEQVHTECDLVLAAADRQAEAIRAEAEAQGRALAEQGRADGVAAASIGGAQEEARAHRNARALVLAAQRSLYDELDRRAREAAHALCGSDEYRALLERLAATARAQLGDDAELEIDPPDAGGVRARSGGRSVDYTLDAIVGRCLERLGPEVERLWL